MKTIENVTIYKCDFCKKELKRKHSMIAHEKLCNCNPENFKKCTQGCVYLEKKEIDADFETYVDYVDGEQHYRTEKVKVFKCTKFDKLMYPFSIEKRDLPNRFPSTFEEQESMPKECDAFSDNVIDSLWNF